MKTIIALLGVLLTSLIYPQNWTSVIETDIDVSSATSVDIFTNGDGNHIIVQESGSLKYYNMDVEGNNNRIYT